MTLKRLGLTSILLILLVTIVSVLFNSYDTKRQEEILSGMDTRLAKYDLAKSTALEIQDVISIRNQEDYDLQKSQFKKKMSDKVFKEYFPSDKYSGGKKSFTIVDTKATGDILSDREFVFKLEITISDKGATTPIVLLVFIKDNIVNKIQSLG